MTRTTKSLPKMGKETEPVVETPIEEKKEASKYTQEELLAIFDELLFTGYYDEKINVRDKLFFTLRSKTMEDWLAINTEMDSKKFNLISSAVDERANLSLARSLVEYNGKDLSRIDWKDRVAFVRGLPVAFIAIMTKHLNEFEAKVNEATSEGEENF